MSAAVTAFKTLDDADLAGQRALVRVDLNVPMEDGKVTDTTRIDRILPTIREIAAKGAKVILLAHFGRPKGPDTKNSLKQVVPALAHALGSPVTFVDDCIGDDVARAVAAAKNGDVLLLENTRFHAGDEKNDPAFVKALAANGDLYVNDAFSAAHRAHASTEGPRPSSCRPLPAAPCRPSWRRCPTRRSTIPPARSCADRRRRQGLDQARPARQPRQARSTSSTIGGGMANTFLAARGDR